MRCCGLQRLRSIATLCVLLAVAVVLYNDPFLLLWWPQKPDENVAPGFPLDMAPRSIDEMFDGCWSEAAAIIDVFGVFESKFNKNFADAWDSVENQIKKPVPKPLTDDHAVVLFMYTNYKFIQQDFNNALKNGKSVYNTAGFKFHYFYFYLTVAIQLLRQNQTRCTTSYYGTGTQFQLNVNHTTMRFGSFVWAWQDKNLLHQKSRISCFEIYTCFGADISNYSAVNLKGQLLIPPYEVFQITNIQTKNTWCSVIYKLHSTKTPRSDLNCRLNLGQSESYFVDILRHWRMNSILLISLCIFVLIYAVFINQWCRCHRLQPCKQSLSASLYRGRHSESSRSLHIQYRLA